MAGRTSCCAPGTQQPRCGIVIRATPRLAGNIMDCTAQIQLVEGAIDTSGIGCRTTLLLPGIEPAEDFAADGDAIHVPVLLALERGGRKAFVHQIGGGVRSRPCAQQACEQP